MLVQRYTTDHDIAAANRRKGCAFHALAFALQRDGGRACKVLVTFQVRSAALIKLFAFAAVFAGVGVLQAFNGQVAGGDVGGVGHHNGAALGQGDAGAAEVTDVEAGVDVLGGFAAAV